MSKKVVGVIKLQIGAGQANPAPPIGPALGQKGANIMEFCKAFNDMTKHLEKGTIVSVLINVHEDKSLDIQIKKSPMSVLIKSALKLNKGSSNPGKEVAGFITKEQLVQIAEDKQEDLNSFDIEGAINMVKGTAISMGLEIKE